MKTKLHQGLTLLFGCTVMLLGINQAMATSGVGNDVEDICASAGNPILPEFNSNLSSDCTACHNDGDGGSGAGRTAASGSDATIIDFFCPEQIATGPTCTDNDGDGFFVEGSVCGTAPDFNDNNANLNPGATEICTDGIDNDGNGLTDAADPNAVNCPLDCTDNDGDGFNTDGGSCGPMDCNDSDAAINPGAVENCSDNVDNNCNGLVDSADMNAVGCPLDCTDNDGDGYAREGGACGAMDCNDNNGAVNPGAIEACDDGIDNNCNNLTDAQDSVCQTTPTGGNNDDEDSSDEAQDAGDAEQDAQPWWRNRRDRDEDSRSSSRDRRSSRRSRDRDDD